MLLPERTTRIAPIKSAMITINTVPKISRPAVRKFRFMPYPPNLLPIIKLPISSGSAPLGNIPISSPP